MLIALFYSKLNFTVTTHEHLMIQ